jgi:hypothetical protein
MTGREPWICPACNRTVATSYCPDCGERSPRANDLTFRGLFRQAVEAFTDIDGRVIRSFRHLVTRPGALTVAYLRGQKKAYLLPFQIFLVANVLFFAIQSLTGENVFSTTLDSHLHHQDWSAYAQVLVTHRVESLHTTLDRYAPVFDEAVGVNAKSLIILMVLVFALLTPLVFYRSHRSFGTHLVFSLHLYAFLLLLFCVALVVAGVDVWFGGAGLASPRVDYVLSITQLLICAVYLYLATGKVYGTKRGVRIGQVSLLAFAVACLVLGYRFVLLPITLYTT